MTSKMMKSKMRTEKQALLCIDSDVDLHLARRKTKHYFSLPSKEHTVLNYVDVAIIVQNIFVSALTTPLVMTYPCVL